LVPFCKTFVKLRYVVRWGFKAT